MFYNIVNVSNTFSLNFNLPFYFCSLDKLFARLFSLAILVIHCLILCVLLRKFRICASLCLECFSAQEAKLFPGVMNELGTMGLAVASQRTEDSAGGKYKNIRTELSYVRCGRRRDWLYIIQASVFIMLFFFLAFLQMSPSAFLVLLLTQN
jgi:hypothetical protein